MTGFVTDAGEAVCAALLGKLARRPALSGVAGLKGGDSGGALPQLAIEPPQVGDWGTKTARGREVRTAVSVRVARGQSLRLPAMAAALEAAGEALGGDIGGWSVASAVLLRTRQVDRGDGTRVVQVEHRVRVLES